VQQSDEVFKTFFNRKKLYLTILKTIEYIKTETDTNWRQDIQLNDTQQNDIHSNGINIDC
jgi:hypothetical protein